MKKTEQHKMGSVEKNMGFIFDSRWMDSALTLTCIGLTALSIFMNDDMMVAFAVPAGIGLFRQFVPLLTFPYVITIFFATVLMSSSLGIFEFIGL